MIGCDGPRCALKWFHSSCAGIERRWEGGCTRGRMALCSVQVFLIM